MNPAPVIGLVDDEPGMLKALQRLLGAEGFTVRAFASAADFLERGSAEPIDCLVLDVAMPGLSGLDLQAQLRRRGARLPIVFLTGRGDIPMSVRAIQAGAVNFLTKPVDASALLAAVRAALEEARRIQRDERELADLRQRFARLTPREFEVLRHVIAGKLNKQIAADLGTGEQTIKVHRMRITEKLGWPSVAEWVRAAERLGVKPPGISASPG
jgi:FixJ family two-component response regulator